jgi:TP901 family phage tail tape measure protein
MSGSVTVGSVIVDFVGNASKLFSTMSAMEKRFSEYGGKAKDAGGVLAQAITLPVLAITGGGLKAASDFESAFAGVVKTFKGSKEELKGVEIGIREMAKSMPVANEELAGIAANASQLGVAKEDVLQFTETIARLGVSTNLSSEEAAIGLARFQNVTKSGKENISQLGSAIVFLGNNFATTESDVLAMATRLAKAGETAGLSRTEILGLSASLSAVGIEAEAGGSAVSRIMIEMQVAARKGGEDLNQYAKIAETTSAKFKELAISKPGEALKELFTGLGNIKDRGGDVFAALEKIGIEEVRTRDAALGLANASKMLDSAMRGASDAAKENTALTIESAARFATFESMLKQTWNTVKDVAVTFGNALLPVAKDVLSVVREAAPIVEKFAKAFANLSPEAKIAGLAIVGFGAAIGPALIFLGQMTIGITTLVGSFKTLGGAMAATIGVSGGGAGMFGFANAAVLAGTALVAFGAAATAFVAVGLYAYLSKLNGEAEAAYKNLEHAGAVIAKNEAFVRSGEGARHRAAIDARNAADATAAAEKKAAGEAMARHAAAEDAAKEAAKAVKALGVAWGQATDTKAFAQVQTAWKAMLATMDGRVELIPKAALDAAISAFERTGKAGIAAAEGIRKSFDSTIKTLQQFAAINSAGMESFMPGPALSISDESMTNVLKDRKLKELQEFARINSAGQGAFMPGVATTISRETLEALATGGKHTQKMAFDFAAMMQSASSLKSILGSAFGNITAGLASIAGGAAALFSKGKDGSLLGNLFSGKDLLKNLSSALPAIGAMAGPVIGAIKGWFEGRKLDEIAKNAGRYLGESITKETAKAINETQKTLGVSLQTASLLNLDKVMAGKDPSKFIAQIADLMKGIASGSVPAAQGLEQIGKAWSQIVDGATKAGRVGDAVMVGMLKSARAAGGSLYTADMKAFTADKLSDASAGLQKFIDGISKLDGEFGRMGQNAASHFMAAFGAIAKEKGWIAAVDELGKSFETLKEKLEKALRGDTASTDAMLAPFERMSNFLANDVLRGAVDAADGLRMMMVGLADAGYLTNEQFVAMQQTTADLFNHMLEGSGDLETSLAAIAPNIQAAISAAEQFGIPLDEDMQKLKELAEANGYTFRTDPMMRMVEVLEAIARHMGALAGEADATGDALDKNFNKTYTTTFDRRYTGGDPSTSDAGGGPPTDFTAASGFFSASMPRGRHEDGMTIMGVHPGERVSVIPKNQNTSGGPAASAPQMAQITLQIGPHVLGKVITDLARQGLLQIPDHAVTGNL